MVLVGRGRVCYPHGGTHGTHGTHVLVHTPTFPGVQVVTKPKRVAGGTAVISRLGEADRHRRTWLAGGMTARSGLASSTKAETADVLPAGSGRALRMRPLRILVQSHDKKQGQEAVQTVSADLHSEEGAATAVLEQAHGLVQLPAHTSCKGHLPATPQPWASGSVRGSSTAPASQQQASVTVQAHDSIYPGSSSVASTVLLVEQSAPSSCLRDSPVRSSSDSVSTAAKQFVQPFQEHSNSPDCSMPEANGLAASQPLSVAGKAVPAGWQDLGPARAACPSAAIPASLPSRIPCCKLSSGQGTACSHGCSRCERSSGSDELLRGKGRALHSSRQSSTQSLDLAATVSGRSDSLLSSRQGSACPNDEQDKAAAAEVLDQSGSLSDESIDVYISFVQDFSAVGQQDMHHQQAPAHGASMRSDVQTNVWRRISDNELEFTPTTQPVLGVGDDPHTPRHMQTHNGFRYSTPQSPLSPEVALPLQPPCA